MKIKILLLILLSVLSFSVSSGQKANKKTVISGSVTDSQQKPVKGALILIDGAKTNISSNNKGMYKVKVRPDADSISVVSFYNGMRTEAIGSRTVINFALGASVQGRQGSPDNQAQNESVNIGYGNVDKKNLLTPVSTIDARNGRYANYKNIYEILRGTPGVIVNGNSVKIQGQSSFNSGTEPLFVVDGVSVQSIEGISPITVESISVLKGSSTSIYGSRGANGVILINLIKSKSGK